MVVCIMEDNYYLICKKAKENFPGVSLIRTINYCNSVSFLFMY